MERRQAAVLPALPIDRYDNIVMEDAGMSELIGRFLLRFPFPELGLFGKQQGLLEQKMRL